MYNLHSVNHIKTFINNLGPGANSNPAIRSRWRVIGRQAWPPDLDSSRPSTYHSRRTTQN